MNTLERDTYSDGFRILLLGVHCDRGSGRFEFRATLFDGGRSVAEMHGEDAFYDPSDVFTPVYSLLAKVTESPHVLAVYGNAALELMAQGLPPIVTLEDLRVLDVRRTAVALCPGMKMNAGLSELLSAYGSPTRLEDDTALPSALADLLWAVIGEAGGRGMGWGELLGYADASRRQAPFEKYGFSEETVAQLPAAPAVYVFRSEEGGALYVGKSECLVRRMAEYFRPVREESQKLQTLRSRIHDLEYHWVGSGLEALLLEHRLIRDLSPEINVQRAIVEQTSRYAYPALPVAVISPSAMKNRAEVFFFGPPSHAFQLRVDPARPPRRVLAKVADMLCARSVNSPRSARLTDWGPEGYEICARYFCRCRDGLQWLEVNSALPVERFVDALADIVRRVAERGCLPGEFRVGKEAEAL